MPLLYFGEQLIATTLKHDSKSTSYKLALLRAINDVALTHPEPITRDVAVPLRLLAEHWIGYYWPFAHPLAPIYQGARAQRDGVLRNDLSFRPALTRLQQAWENEVRLLTLPSDGHFLVSEMQTPRRRAMYSLALAHAYDEALRHVLPALAMPIKFAGAGHWTVFAKPELAKDLPTLVQSLPGTQARDSCLIIPLALWKAISRLSLYVEALCIHEWSLFTEAVRQEGSYCTRGQAYALLTAQPDNRRPLSWERNQVDVLLFERHTFTCTWTQKRISKPHEYDLDHLLPVSLYPINELWNLLPVDKKFNRHVKRDRVPSPERLATALPWLRQSYETYLHSSALEGVFNRNYYV